MAEILKLKRIVDIEYNDITIDSNIYHDNFPDPCWKEVSTYPKHFHNGSQNNIEESRINDDPISGIREFMNFIRNILELDE